MKTKPLPTFNPWPWLPPLVLLVTAIPSLIIVFIAHHMHLDLVESLPYLASIHFDADQEGRQGWTEAGYRLRCEDGSALQLRLQLEDPRRAGLAGEAVVVLYRPDDATLDRTFNWPVPTQPLQVTLPRPGLWRIHLELTIPSRLDRHPLSTDAALTLAGPP